jgi:hypothetical protein
MVKQAAYKVSTLKLSGKETLKEFFRVNFPDSNLIEVLDDGQRQKNLGICGCITNRRN